MTTELGVHSEVGKLRKVIVHRPDLSLKRLTPTNHDDLLFDDVLWVERAQWEHDQFTQAMRERGTEVFYHVDLLGEALAAAPEGRRNIIEMVASEYTVGWSLVDEAREYLSKLKPDVLARHLVGGLLLAGTHAGIFHVGALEELGFGGSWHQTRDAHPRIAQFGAQRIGERVQERFGSVVDRLIGPRHETGDRSCDQEAAVTALPHFAHYLLNQIDRARDVRVDHMPDCREVLI